MVFFFFCVVAYWISFGPHGPRAETPKGEGWKVLYQTSKYMVITFAIFCAIRSMANPEPKTMTKEWQDMTNEYAKVRMPSRESVIAVAAFLLSPPRGLIIIKLTLHRLRKSTLFTASAARDTAARASSNPNKIEQSKGRKGASPLLFRSLIGGRAIPNRCFPAYYTAILSFHSLTDFASHLARHNELYLSIFIH